MVCTPSLFLMWLFLLAAIFERVNTNAVQPHGKNTVLWVPNLEGFFSHVLQLKTLSFVIEVSKSNRSILMGDFFSRHYGDRQAHIRFSDVLKLPDHITCVPSKRMLTNCSRDIRVVYSPDQDVCFRGIPTWETLHHKPQLLRHQVSALAPRLTFHDKFHRIVDDMKSVLGLSGGYVAIHWRRGDQLSTRCVRKMQYTADRSINCGSSEDFIQYLRGTKPLFPGLPFVLITNEEDADMLRAVAQEKVTVITPALVAATLFVKDVAEAVELYGNATDRTAIAGDDINRRVLSGKKGPWSRDNSHKHSKEAKQTKQKKNQPEEKNTTEPIRNPGNASESAFKKENQTDGDQNARLEAEAYGRTQVFQLAIDSVFLLDATVMLAFGMSTMHDALEAERMQRGLSYCVEKQNIGSFCASLLREDKIYLNSTMENDFSEKSISDFLARFKSNATVDNDWKPL